jgi:2-hydroxy-3-keto-5-methylthiopentenyl-1-phosphate phosphatase
MSALEQEHFKIIVFVGNNQVKISFEIASLLQKVGERASYIKISGNGSNALDFHIAYYIGQIAAREPDAYFHIISKDTGFDPLIAHLKSKKIFASRSKDINDIPLVKAANSKSSDSRLDIVVAKLQQMGTSKPRVIKTLSSTINSLFQKSLSDDEVGVLLKDLQGKGLIDVADNKVSYTLSA